MEKFFVEENGEYPFVKIDRESVYMLQSVGDFELLLHFSSISHRDWEYVKTIRDAKI